MEMKNSLEADALANLYRSALYLGRGSIEMGESFFKKAKDFLGNKIGLSLRELEGRNLKYWAEMVLDEYKRIKINLSSK